MGSVSDGVLPGDIGDVTLAAMTNLESDNSTGNTIEREEDEEEVYGIFTGIFRRFMLILYRLWMIMSVVIQFFITPFP